MAGSDLVGLWLQNVAKNNFDDQMFSVLDNEPVFFSAPGMSFVLNYAAAFMSEQGWRPEKILIKLLKA